METDILITSLALYEPGTREEITVISADQHVCFLRIDGLKGPGITHVLLMHDGRILLFAFRQRAPLDEPRGVYENELRLALSVVHWL